MSTTTTRSLRRRAPSAWLRCEQPEFRVTFTAQRTTPPTNSFHWFGAGTLRIGPYGVLVSARRRALKWFYRRQRLFIAAAEIRNVYRERNALRVELQRHAAPLPFFHCWVGDPSMAATIVTLLPTARTVELEEDAAAFATPDRLPRYTPHWAWATAGGLGLTALLAGLACVLLYPPPPAAPHAVGPPFGAVNRLSAAQALGAQADFERFGGRIDGLIAQFSRTFAALQAGTLPAAEFASGLEQWQIPQWRLLRQQLSSFAPAHSSPRWAMHDALASAAAHWQNGMTLYAAGLRAGDSARVLAAFCAVKRAEQAERLARGRLEELERATVNPVRQDPPL